MARAVLPQARWRRGCASPPRAGGGSRRPCRRPSPAAACWLSGQRGAHARLHQRAQRIQVAPVNAAGDHMPFAEVGSAAPAASTCSTAVRASSRVAPSTPAAMPSPSRTRPSSRCSVPINWWPRPRASTAASVRALFARGVRVASPGTGDASATRRDERRTGGAGARPGHRTPASAG